MNIQQRKEILNKEFIFYSQWWGVQKVKESDMADIPRRLKVLQKYHKDMYDAGTKIHTFDVATGWLGPNHFDYSDCDRVLEAFFSACPDAYLIPRITDFNTTNEWEQAYPTEVYLFEEGKDLSPEQIHEIIGTEQQGNWRDDLGLIGSQSFASEIWRRDALDALRRLIEHTENSPYGKQILGYHVGYGHCGETHFWGDGADFSVASKKAFYRFGLQKYKTEEALAKAWKQEKVSEKNVPIPTNAESFPKTAQLDEYAHIGDTVYRDYNEFTEQLSASLIHDFGKTVKDMTGKLVGFFHGYLLYNGANHHGHTDIKYLLDDPNVDFLATPKCYYRAGFGEPGGSYCVPLSVNRKIKWVDELDDRTHKVDCDDMWGGTKTPEESIWVMRREFARNEMTGSAYWWMDLGGGWYDDKALQEEIRRLYGIKQQLAAKPGKVKSIAEILLVADETCANYVTQSFSFYHRTLQDAIFETAMTGTTFDVYRLSDLDEIDLSRYKLVIFLNPFSVTAEKFQAYHFSANTRFIWNYVPGGSVAEAKKLCGMTLRETGKEDSFPFIEIMPEKDLKVLETYAQPTKNLDAAKCPFVDTNKECFLHHLPEEGIRTAVKGNHCVCTVPAMDQKMIRALAEEAGCKFYAPVGTIVYGNNKFIATFNKDGDTFQML